MPIPKPPRCTPPKYTHNEELTTVQKLTLAAYDKLMKQNDGHPPTYAQLAHALGVSRPTAFAAIKRLRDKGFITERKVTVRMQLTAKGARALPPKRGAA